MRSTIIRSTIAPRRSPVGAHRSSHHRTPHQPGRSHVGHASPPRPQPRRRLVRSRAPRVGPTHRRLPRTNRRRLPGLRISGRPTRTDSGDAGARRCDGGRSPRWRGARHQVDVRGLNDAGLATGSRFVQTVGDWRPYRWTPGSGFVRLVGICCGTAWGTDINNAGCGRTGADGNRRGSSRLRGRRPT